MHTHNSGINETNISILRLWGMDIGFEGNFSCLKKSINEELHPEWINSTENEWVTVSPTSFETIFANDIKPDAKAAWVSYFLPQKANANEIYHLESIVDLVKKNGKLTMFFQKTLIY